MLLDGLRSREVLDLRLEDLQPAEAQIRISGKGNKHRVLPVPAETIEVLQNYLRLERPLTNSPSLFVSLKGRQRGQPITPGWTPLFVLCSQVLQANPHRLRHTFGTSRSWTRWPWRCSVGQAAGPAIRPLLHSTIPVDARKS
jgi:integrase/recombinase XerC